MTNQPILSGQAQTISSVRQATGRFTQIANEALRDPRLSYRAKGILAAALTHEPGFSFGRPWIDSHGTEGRDAITAAIAELKALGYCRSARTKNEAGDWQGTTLVFTDDGTTENPSPHNAATENAATENAATENPSLLKKTNRRTPVEEHQKKEPPLPPTGGPGVGAHPLQPTLLPIETPVAKPVPPAKTRPRSTPSPIPPDFAHLSELISAWLEMRLQVNPRTAPRIDPWGPRQKSASALRLAIAKGVAVPFLEMAAERGWVSLGHAGHSADIERLASPSAPRSNRWAPPEPPVLQDYKPGRR